MPQALSPLSVVLLDGQRFHAVATGNNAAWHCVCDELLLGRTGLARGVTDGFRVDCLCGKSYFVVPAAGDQSSALRVEEVTR